MRRVLFVFAVVFLLVSQLVEADDTSQQVPVFPNLTFTALDGVSQIDLESVRGRPVLLTFWASALPTNVLLDREGRPVQIYRGYSPEVPGEIRRLILAMDPAPGDGGGPSGR